VLILVLAMIGLLALVGATFVAISGRARINARNFARSLMRPESNELLDFAVSQLVLDTANPPSALRGHSLPGDMYGNDASSNGILVDRPDGRAVGPFANPRFYVLAAAPDQGSARWQLRTNIPARDPALYGYSSTRWVMRFFHQGAASPRPV